MQTDTLTVPGAPFRINTWDDEPDATPAVLLMIKDEMFLANAAKIPTEYLLLSEIGLEEEIRDRAKERKFDKTLGLLKIAFWDEYHRAVHRRVDMNLEHVWKPLVGNNYWLVQVVNHRLHMAWMITPPADELATQREMLQLGYKRMREVLDLPMLEPHTVYETDVEDPKIKRAIVNHRPNVSLLKEMHNIVKTLQDRVHGSVTQKHQVLTKNLNVNVPAPLPSASIEVTPSQETSVVGSKKKIVTLPPISLEGTTTLTLADLEAYEEKLLSIEERIGSIVSRTPEMPEVIEVVEEPE